MVMSNKLVLVVSGVLCTGLLASAVAQTQIIPVAITVEVLKAAKEKDKHPTTPPAAAPGDADARGNMVAERLPQPASRTTVRFIISGHSFRHWGRRLPRLYQAYRVHPALAQARRVDDISGPPRSVVHVPCPRP